MTEKPCGCHTFFCEHYGRRLQWIPVERITQVARTGGMIVLWGFGIIMALYVLNWAPLWGRLHAACMTQQPEADTVAHDVHFGLAERRISERAAVLATAYAAHPERFPAGSPKPAAAPTEVWINPPHTRAAEDALWDESQNTVGI